MMPWNGVELLPPTKSTTVLVLSVRLAKKRSPSMNWVKPAFDPLTEIVFSATSVMPFEPTLWSLTRMSPRSPPSLAT